MVPALKLILPPVTMLSAVTVPPLIFRMPVLVTENVSSMMSAMSSSKVSEPANGLSAAVTVLPLIVAADNKWTVPPVQINGAMYVELVVRSI